jgi:large subunit ribosomal protein L15
MKLEALKPAKGSIKKVKRIGRGQGSGKGGTSTKGHKGAQSRAGYKRKRGFEGGQMPLQRRVPKFGFNNPDKVVMKPINLDTLQMLADEKKMTEVTIQSLMDNGLVGKKDIVKVLGRGELTAKVNVTAHKFSKTAQEAIEKAGGSVTIVE